MKILIEATALIDPQKTGIPYFLDGIIKELSKEKNIQIELLYTNFLNRRNISMPEYGENVSYKKVVHIPGGIYRFAARKFGIILPLEFMTLKKYDWILFPNYGIMNTFKKTKKMTYIHDMTFIDHPEWADSKNAVYLQKITPKAVQKADAIGVVSNFTKSRLLKHFDIDESKIFVTYIPPVLHAQKIPLTTSLDNLGIKKGKYFLFVGTVEPRKNPQLLVESYLNLPDKVKDEYSLVMAGKPGWKMNDFPEFVAKKVNKQGGNIILTGYVTENDRQALYSNAKAFVLPSYYEGFGMPVMEALAYKLPCIVSNIEVFKEIFGEHVLYIKNDVDLTKALGSVVLDDKEYDSQQFIEGFTWKDTGKIIVDTLKASS